jgi:hypothetical protein
MVAETFLGGVDDGMVVCHLNGDRSNNAVWNIMIASHKENMSHRRLHGSHYVGGSNPMSVLTEKEVKEIRALEGARLADDVAAEYGVTHMAVRRIWSGEAWAEPETEFSSLVKRIATHEEDADVAEALPLIALARFSRTAVSDLSQAADLIKRIADNVEVAK